MFALPTNPATREKLGDISAVVEMLHPKNIANLPTLKDARFAARDFFAESPAAKSICTIYLSATGDLMFGEFKLNSWKKLWKFTR